MQVKKEGPNKGRWFYACAKPPQEQCDFFDWVIVPQNASQDSKTAPGTLERLVYEVRVLGKKIDDFIAKINKEGYIPLIEPKDNEIDKVNDEVQIMADKVRNENY